MIHKQNGFALIAFLALMPLLLSIAAFLFAGWLVLKSDSETRQICRAEVLETQNLVAKNLNSLLELNAEAKTLRIEREAAEIAVKIAAASPPALATARAALNGIKLMQQALNVRQKALILEARTRSMVEPPMTLYKIREAINRASFNEASWVSLILAGPPKLGKFPVVASPQDSTTPDYQPASNFVESQRINVKWILPIASLLPEWINKFLSEDTEQKWNLKLQCSVKIEKENEQWVARISEGKSSSNFSFASFY